MSIDKSIQYEVQGGVKNYKPSKMVTVPKKAKSSPKHPETELAYITKAEKDLLIKKDLHNSLKGKPNKGPGNVMSLNGDYSDMMSGITGADISAAERGEGPRGAMTAQDAQDFRSAAIAAGAGQRVNPGFFDSKNTVSPLELQLAKKFDPSAFKAVRGGGLLSFIRGGGIMGNLIRSLGQKLGFGKTYDQPTYDMSQFNNLGLLTNTINPTYYNDLGNEGILSTEESKNEQLFDPNYIKSLIDKAVVDTQTSALPSNNVVAFEPGTKLDRTLKNLYSGYENLGIIDPDLIPLMEQDIKENQEKGTPLSLPKNAYSLIG